MSSAAIQPPYRLAPYVHACRIRDDIIILDLKNNQYLGMSGEEADTLDGYVAGFPTKKREAAGSDATDSISPVSPPTALTEMETMGLIARMEAHVAGKHKKNLVDILPRPERPVIDGYHEYGHDIGPISIFNFIYTATKSAIAQRTLSFERIITGSPWKKKTLPPEPDLKKAEIQVNTYNILRRFAYTAHDTCVYTSISMRAFLAKSHIHPLIVIGVASRPFKAHCWLQYGDLVFNDVPEYVREYTPIFACQ